MHSRATVAFITHLLLLSLTIINGGKKSSTVFFSLLCELESILKLRCKQLFRFAFVVWNFKNILAYLWRFVYAPHTVNDSFSRRQETKLSSSKHKNLDLRQYVLCETQRVACSSDSHFLYFCVSKQRRTKATSLLANKYLFLSVERIYFFVEKSARTKCASKSYVYSSLLFRSTGSYTIWITLD